MAVSRLLYGVFDRGCDVCDLPGACVQIVSRTSRLGVAEVAPNPMTGISAPVLSFTVGVAIVWTDEGLYPAFVRPSISYMIASRSDPVRRSALIDEFQGI